MLMMPRKNLVFLILVGVQIWGSVQTGVAQPASGVVIELGLGPYGTATELLTVPGYGKPMRDPSWIFETFPEGTPNPAFPPPAVAPVTPLQYPLPTEFGGLGRSWPGFGIPGEVVVSTDRRGTMPEVLATGFVVIGWKGWQNSEFRVRPGDRFELKATDRWSGHFEEFWSGPEGFGPEKSMETKAGHPPRPAAFSRAQELIGRIGAGPGFRVGAGGSFTADADGSL